MLNGIPSIKHVACIYHHIHPSLTTDVEFSHQIRCANINKYNEIMKSTIIGSLVVAMGESEFEMGGPDVRLTRKNIILLLTSWKRGGGKWEVGWNRRAAGGFLRSVCWKWSVDGLVCANGYIVMMKLLMDYQHVTRGTRTECWMRTSGMGLIHHAQMLH